MGVPMGKVTVRLGDSAFGSGGQFGAANATSGVDVYTGVARVQRMLAV